MNKKRFLKLLCALMVTLFVLFSLTACGAANGADKGGAVYDEYVDNGYGGYEEDFTADEAFGGTSDSSSASQLRETRKIIETIDYSVETKAFDELVSTLENKALSCGGYVESSDVSGNSYDDKGTRYATYVFRIPSDKVTEFTTYLSENSTITNKSVNTEDVTLEYVDTESRIKALKAEKESLEALLKDASTTSEIIEIRDMLTEVIYEIESYESRLRTLDNLVDFTTVTINVDEVEHTTVVKKQNFIQRIGSNLAENFRDVWNFIVEFIVFIISALPYILLVGVNVVVIFLIIKLSIKKRRKKIALKTKKAEEKPEE